MSVESNINFLVSWLNKTNDPHSDHEVAMRLLKVTEEAGEAAQAYIGFTGQNPRKGITHDRGDVADELCDVIVTAMVALHSFTEMPGSYFSEHTDRLVYRIRESE